MLLLYSLLLCFTLKMPNKGKASSARDKLQSTADEPDPPSTDHTECITMSLLQATLDKSLAPINREIKKISDTVTTLQAIIGRVNTLETTVGTIETSLTSYSNELDSIKSKVLPDLSDHVSTCEQQLADYILSIDAHRRKWNVTFHGIKGDIKEDESVTRRKTIEFAHKYLGLSKEDAASTGMSACHRLSNKKDAGVIVRFSDLSKRDQWLAGTRKLKDTAGELKISVSVDLPPAVRPLKDELMLRRSKMDRAQRMKTKLKYLTRFPYVELRAEGQPSIRPSKSLREVTKEILGNLDPSFHVPVG